MTPLEIAATYPQHIAFNYWLIKTYVPHRASPGLDQQIFDGLTKEQIQLVDLMLDELDQYGLVRRDVFQPTRKPGRSGRANFVLKEMLPCSVI